MSTKPINNILLIITGSIAAYKGLDLIRLLKNNCYDVTVVLTEAAKKFVTPLSVASLSQNTVYDDIFSLTDEVQMGHITLARKADTVLIAPASADIIAKVAHGLANDLASTILLATEAPVYIAPAMNSKMWKHPAVVRNVKQLTNDGCVIIAPEKGNLACGEEGYGRMASPEKIVSTIKTS